MRTNDAKSDLDRELARLKLRDIVIGSTVAGVLLAMMPGDAQRGAASTAIARPRISLPLLPKPKPDCTKIENGPAPCSPQKDPQYHQPRYREHAQNTHHRLDIRV